MYICIQIDGGYIDRMSTVSVMSKGKHRREHSFKKQPIKGQQQQSVYCSGQIQKNNTMPPLNSSQSKPSSHISSSSNTNRIHSNSYHTNTQQSAYNPNMRAGAPTSSGLSKQIAPQKHTQQHQSVMQSRNSSGKLVVKQLPYSKKTHV